MLYPKKKNDPHFLSDEKPKTKKHLTISQREQLKHQILERFLKKFPDISHSDA
jgi:hypothetical protein